MQVVTNSAEAAEDADSAGSLRPAGCAHRDMGRGYTHDSRGPARWVLLPG